MAHWCYMALYIFLITIVSGNDLSHWRSHWRMNKMADFLQTTFSNAISQLKIIVPWFKFHWNLFLKCQLTMMQYLLVQAMAWCQTSIKPLPEQMLNQVTHTCQPVSVCSARMGSVHPSPPGQNGRHLCRQFFQMHFCELKILYFDSNFTDVCS